MGNVTITEKVNMWLREHEIGDSNKPLYEAFPDVSRNTLKQYKRNFIMGKKPRIPKEKIYQAQSDNQVAQNNSSENSAMIEEDLLKDIKKVKAVMNQFGEGVRLKEVTEFLKEMNALKPSIEDDIKQSLKNEDVNLLLGIINPNFNPQPALPTAFPKYEIDSLFNENEVNNNS